MRIPPNKSGVELREIAQDERLRKQEEFTKGTAKNLTTLDTIGLVVLIVFQLVLSHSMQIEYDSLKERADDNA